MEWISCKLPLGVFDKIDIILGQSQCPLMIVGPQAYQRIQRRHMLSALHVACLDGMIEIIHCSLLRIIHEAMNRSTMPHHVHIESHLAYFFLHKY